MQVDLLTLIYKGFLFLLIVVVAIILTKIIGKYFGNDEELKENSDGEKETKNGKK